MSYVRSIVLVLGAAFVGLLWGWMLFAEVGSGGLAVAAALYLVTGAAFGLALGRRWWLAGIAGWPGVAIGLIAILDGNLLSLLAFLGLSVLPALVGARAAHAYRARANAG